MPESFEHLKTSWQQAKSEQHRSTPDVGMIRRLSRNKMKEIRKMHWGTIAILLLTLIGISAFFIYVAPFQQLLSHIGQLLMVGVLMARIGIEIYSIYRSRGIDLSLPATQVNTQQIDFHNYRKHLHGYTTLGLLLVYSVGFYLLIPEFILYLSSGTVVLLCISYLVAFDILGYFIRIGIRREMMHLEELTELRKRMEEVL